VTGRPQPPRSNSASYLHKHRRSPSIQKVEVAPPTPAEAPQPSIQAVDFAHNSSVRQSPPPINNLRIPTGMVISPPDSSESSDGDENVDTQRGRELEKNWDQLKEAVRAIDQKREGSLDKVGVQFRETTSAPLSQSTSPTALAPEARKIAHSRSSTETAIIIPKSTAFESPTQTSDDSSEDENGPLSKPVLVRKKSGELVKPALRPSSRRRYSSMPGTPTYSKSVHFNDSDNQTRHFLQVDKPIAVSAGSSPVETYDSESEFPFDGESGTAEREIKLTNFPEDSFDRRTLPVRVERIFLSPDKQTLIGTIAVQNIAFHKEVHTRFTLDYWKTTSEVLAEFNNDPNNRPSDGCDRFNFHIKLSDQANIDTKTMLLCVRYKVNGQEYWDNNQNRNYQIDFVRSVKKAAKPSSSLPGVGARPLNAIPRSRHTGHSLPPTARVRADAIDDEFARLDNSSAYQFGATDKLLGEVPGSIKLKARSKRGSIFPTDGAQVANGLGGRYDFGASLSAALSNAQDKLGRQSGLMNAPQKSGSHHGSYFGPIERKEGPIKVNERPDSLTTDRPAMGSDQYRDLVQKFCYFTSGPGKVSSPQSEPKAAHQPKTDGADDSNTSSTLSSISPSPQLDGPNDRAQPAFGPFLSRSGSPAPMTGGGLGARAASPISFGYPYYSNSRDGYLSDSQAPTAIQG